MGKEPKDKKLKGKLLEEHRDVSSAGYYPDVRKVMLDARGKEVWIDNVETLIGEGEMNADGEVATVFFKENAVCRVVEVEPFPKFFIARGIRTKGKEKAVICYKPSELAI